MGRRKISIRRIADDRNRHVTFIKRNNGLLKKAMELALLCGCDISLIVISDSGKATTFSTTSLTDTMERIQSGLNIKEHNAFSVADYVRFSSDSVDKDEDGSEIPLASPPEGYYPPVTYSSLADTRATDSLIAAMMMRNDGGNPASGSDMPSSGYTNSINLTRPKPVHPPGLSETTRNNKRHVSRSVDEESKSSVTPVHLSESGSGLAHWNNSSPEEKEEDQPHRSSQEVEVATILASSSVSHMGDATDSTSAERETARDMSTVRPDRKRPHHAIEENPFLAPNRGDFPHPGAFNQGYYGNHPMMYFPQARNPHSGQGFMMYPNGTEMRSVAPDVNDRPGGGSNPIRRFPPSNVMMNPMSMNPMGYDANFQQMLANQYMMAQQASMFNNHPAHHHGHHAPNVPGDAVEEGDGEGEVTADV